MSNQMFRRQMVSIPLHPGQFLTPHRGAEVITRAYQMTKVGFEWVTVDKPVDGTLLLFASQPGQVETSEDGYGWMDDEIINTFTLETGLEVEISSRSLGFGPGDTSATVQRKKYRVVQNSEIQLLQYCKIPATNIPIPIQPNHAKVFPRNTMMSAQSSPANRAQIQARNLQEMTRKQTIRQTPQVKVIEDERDPDGGSYLWTDTNEIICTLNKYLPLTLQKQMEKELNEYKKTAVDEIEDVKKMAQADWKKIHELKAQR